MDRRPNLLDKALGFDDQSMQSSIGGRVLLIEDCIETSAAFVIYHIVKCSLSSPRSSGVVIFVALSHPFSHYDRVLRKLGCNLAVHRDNKRFIFFDMLMLECQGGNDGNVTKDGLVELFGKIQKEVEVISSKQESERYVMVIIDDFSLIEAAVNGTSNHGSDFLHYCRTLTSEFGSSLVILNHEDIYLGPERPLILQMEYFADILIKAQPLATGVAADVHGQGLEPDVAANHWVLALIALDSSKSVTWLEPVGKLFTSSEPH